MAAHVSPREMNVPILRVALLAIIFATQAQAAPANAIRELWPALTACWHAPAGSAGSQLTILFSLTRDGAVLGKPRITYSKLIGATETQKAFVAAALDALAACTPVAVTPELGGAIAGRILSIRFIGGSKGADL